MLVDYLVTTADMDLAEAVEVAGNMTGTALSEDNVAHDYNNFRRQFEGQLAAAGRPVAERRIHEGELVEIL